VAFKYVQTKFTEEEHARIKALAAEQGKSLARYLHDAALWVDEERRRDIRAAMDRWENENPQIMDIFAKYDDAFDRRAPRPATVRGGAQVPTPVRPSWP
jgi:reverse gyrase